MARREPIAQRGPGQSYRPDRRPPSVFGVHQPSIATPLRPPVSARTPARRRRYDDGIDTATGERDAGLLFLAYQRDLRRQFVVLQRRLAARDALSAYACHVGSAVFALPPGARRGGFIADGLVAP
jgi:hypothetical protein